MALLVNMSETNRPHVQQPQTMYAPTPRQTVIFARPTAPTLRRRTKRATDDALGIFVPRSIPLRSTLESGSKEPGINAVIHSRLEPCKRIVLLHAGQAIVPTFAVVQ